MKPYFIYIDGQQVGPLNFDELRERKINRETLVWMEGKADWQKADTFEELQELFKKIPPPVNVAPILTPPTVEITQTPNYNEHKATGNRMKKVFIGIGLAVLILAGLSAFATYQHDEEIRNQEFEMRIAEQDRQIREQRIAEINKELAESYQTLDKAKAQLHDATAFKLLRTSDERHQQITEAEKVVKSWEEHITVLETELQTLKVQY